MMMFFPLLLLAFPALAVLIIACVPNRLRLCGGISFAASGLSMLSATGLAIWLPASPLDQSLYHFGWIAAHPVSIGYHLDVLTIWMLVFVTTMTSIITLYSLFYAPVQTEAKRYFAYLSFFLFAMLLFILASDLLLLFIGWEGIGLASYLLIAFWFDRQEVMHASLKTLLMNRLGDCAMCLGMALLFVHTGQLSISTILNSLPNTHAPEVWIPLAGIALLIGVFTKSAQLPFSSWLPDAMVAPTPISALIHAATLVIAGVYLIARLMPLFLCSSLLLTVLLWVGTVTAVFAALRATQETTLKRLLAYSTISQIGYLIAALSSGQTGTVLYGLMSHGAIKALLFLLAGTILLSGVQRKKVSREMREMNLSIRTHTVLWFGWLLGAAALAGLPPFSGWYAKADLMRAVLHSPADGSTVAAGLLHLTTLFTAYYAFRALLLMFHSTASKPPMKRVSRTLSYLPLLLLLFVIALGFPLQAFVLYLQRLSSVWKIFPHAPAVTQPYFSYLGVLLAWFVYRHPIQKMTRAQKRLQKWGSSRPLSFVTDVVLVREMRELGKQFYHTGEMQMIEKQLLGSLTASMTKCAKQMKRWHQVIVHHLFMLMVLGGVVILFVGVQR